MAVFKNYIVEKPLQGRTTHNKYFLGETIIEKDNEFYSSKTIDSPIAFKQNLNKNKVGRYYYGRDFPVYRKHRELVNARNYEILFLDIENSGGVKGDIADRELTVLTFNIRNTDYYFTVYPGDERHNWTELDILTKIISTMQTNEFIITGWNIRYDVEFILERYKYLTGTAPNILCPVIDMIALYRHYISQTEKSFKLDYILKKNGLEGKIEYTGESPEELRKTNFQKYVEYNRRDVEALAELDNKLGLFNIAEKIINISHCLWQDVIFNSHIIDSYIYHFLDERDMVFQDKRESIQDESKYKGALVHKPIPGIYKDVRCYDFASLYPNVMMSFNISPETLSKDGTVGAANGAKFVQDKIGFIPEILRNLLDTRKKLKANGDYYGQLAYKILANSFYGVLGSPFFRFYNKKMAEAITLTGQECNKYVCQKLREKFNAEDIILAGDTDSVYVDMSKYNGDGNEIEDYINNVIMKQYGEEHGLKTNTLEVKDEYGSVEAIFLSIKKNYVLKKPDGSMIFKGFDKSDRADIGLVLSKEIVEHLFNTGNTKVIDAAKQYLKQAIEKDLYNTKWYKRYKISKAASEYKTKQMWMRGLELFDFYFANYNKSKNRGYYIPLLGDRRVSKKTGKILKGYEEYVLCVPETANFKEVIETVLNMTGYRIDVNKIYESIYKPMIKPFEVLKKEEN